MTATELYLVLETNENADAAAQTCLAAALDASPLSSVLITPPAEGRIAAHVAKQLIDLAQRKDIAVLLADDAMLARQLRADGVHLSWSKDQKLRYREAREILGTRAIIGADAGRSRDDAMSLGEAGADYVAFGIPPHVEDRVTAAERQADLVDWWSELFELPCVALDVADAAAAANLAQAGADFVAVKISPSTDTPASAQQRIREFAAAVVRTRENVR